jgi:hypothetical protein
MSTFGKKVVTLVAAAIADPNQIAVNISRSWFVGTSALPQIWLTDLDTTKKAYLWRWINEDWVKVNDSAGNQEEFSATRFRYDCTCPGKYGFTKDLSAAVIPVIIER